MSKYEEPTFEHDPTYQPAWDETRPRDSRPLGKRDRPYAWKHVDFQPERQHEWEFGIQYRSLRERFPEMFRGRFDPERLRSDGYRPPSGVESVCEEVFGDKWRRGRTLPGRIELKIAMHPWFLRPCLWELEGSLDRKGDENWYCKQVFHRHAGTEQDEDYLPADLDVFEKQELRGFVGDFCQPTPEWIRWIKENCDREYTSRGVHEPRMDAVPQGCAPGVGIFKKVIDPRDERFTEANRVMNDMVEDSLDYTWNDVTRKSQAHHSAGLIVPQTSLDVIERGRREKMEQVEHESLKIYRRSFAAAASGPATTYFSAEWRRLQRAEENKGLTEEQKLGFHAQDDLLGPPLMGELKQLLSDQDREALRRKAAESHLVLERPSTRLLVEREPETVRAEGAERKPERLRRLEKQRA